MIEVISADGLPDVRLINTRKYGDSRGFFAELWHADKYAAAGLPRQFVQDNLSQSARGVIRGLHYQWPNPQGKLVQVIDGEIFDVAVDIRRGSASFGRWVGVTLRAETGQQIYVPEGFAHGFCVLSAQATVLYKCTRMYDADGDASIAWNDPAIDVDWPLDAPRLSDKDARAPHLSALAPAQLPD